MEMDLSAVIARIKQDGVSQGEKQAADLIKKAEEKADDIIKAAESAKKEIMDKTAEETARLKANAEGAINQAARDVIVSLGAKLETMCNDLIRAEVSAQLSEASLGGIIQTLVTSCLEKGSFDVEILLAEKDRKTLEGAMGSLFSGALAGGIEIKVSPTMKKGFRIGKKGENVYYDFSDEAIAEAFNFYLNKKIREIVKAG